MSSTVDAILQRAVDGDRLSFDDGVTLLKSADLLQLGRAADLVCKRLHPEPYRTYNIDRNINYTNVCAAVCDFCAFYRKVGHAEAYILDRDVLLQKIQETVDIGGDQILMQGGLHPEIPLDWYEDLLRDIKAHFPQVNIHGFSPPEIHFFSKKFKMPLKELLQRLKDAGLGSLPGGGGEILVDRVRKAMTKGKVLSDDWLNVHRVWHELGGKSTATMMFGHVETIEERFEHLVKLREVQAEKPEGAKGFIAFIPWTFQDVDTLLQRIRGTRNLTTPEEYIRMIAMSRIMLPNVKNIQASWLTVGKKVAQICLNAGANDFGSIMIEENVVSAAGAPHRFTAKGIQEAIREAGFEPQLRNQQYEFRKIPEMLEEQVITY